ncbi:hypothetical protein V2J09_023904 [Rumex salicifolius]
MVLFEKSWMSVRDPYILKALNSFNSDVYKMIGSFLTRGLVMIFGYAYPAYECFKTVEKNKPEIEQLRFWCQYWILVAVLTVCERIGDTFVSWIPMYSEAKLAFFIYLWYPKTKGTTYVYDSFFKPYVEKHETDIDRNLMELRTRAGDMAVIYFQKAASYGQTRIFDILQYVASQSTPAPRPQQNQGPRATRQPPTRAQPPDEEPPSPTSSTSSFQQQMEAEQEVSSSTAATTPPTTRNPPRRLVSAPPSASTSKLKKTAQQPEPENSNQSSALKKTASQPPPERSSQSTTNEVDSMQIELANSQGEDKANTLPPVPQSQETAIDEAIRVTRGRLRKTRSTAK